MARLAGQRPRRRARQNILAIDDPAAVAALADGLATEPADEVRVLYVEALARIGIPDAIQALAVCSMEDPVEEVRLTCLDNLQKTRSPDVVGYYVGRLRDKDNRKVNLAAIGLRRMKNASAVGPLIDSLVTVHKFKIVTSNPGSMSTTFGTGPGGSGRRVAAACRWAAVRRSSSSPCRIAPSSRH